MLNLIGMHLSCNPCHLSIDLFLHRIIMVASWQRQLDHAFRCSNEGLDLLRVHCVTVERQLSPLSENHGAGTTSVRFVAGMGMLVLLAILLESECFIAEFALELLDVMLFEVALQRELGVERLFAAEDVAFKQPHRLLLSLTPA